LRQHILALREFIRIVWSASMEFDQLTPANGQKALPPEPQAVVQAVTRAAIFLVATINGGGAFCGDLPALLRSVGTRDIEGSLSCIMGIGSDAWDRLFGQPRPAELHPFREITAGPRRAAATPGDLLFHIRAKRMLRS
jgi:putative iron-dependent peroxidase